MENKNTEIPVAASSMELNIWKDASDLYRTYAEATAKEMMRYRNESEFHADITALIDAGYNENIIYALVPHLFYRDTEMCSQFAAFQTWDTFPSVSWAGAVRRMKKIKDDYPLLDPFKTESLGIMRNIFNNREEKCRDVPSIPKQSKWLKKRLMDAVRYYKSQQVLPERFDDIASLIQDPDIANELLFLQMPLVGITDAGLSHVLGKTIIQDDIWVEAIELTLCQCCANVTQFYSDPNFYLDESILNEIYGVVISNGILIHTLRQFQNPECYRALYERTTGDNVHKEEMQAVRWENSKLMVLTKTYEQQIESLKKQVSQLKKQQNNPTAVKSDTAALVHDHNVAIREKDQEIEQLRAYCKALEEKQAAQEEADFQQAKESNTSPWKNVVLPELNVVFVGGHYNMVKKLKERFPHWYYLTDDSTESLPANISALFVWSNHLSHKLWWRINQEKEAAIDPLYVTATNIDLLIEQMQFEYWKKSEKST